VEIQAFKAILAYRGTPESPGIRVLRGIRVFRATRAFTGTLV
jgi:hypothetical protein